MRRHAFIPLQNLVAIFPSKHRTLGSLGSGMIDHNRSRGPSPQIATLANCAMKAQNLSPANLFRCRTRKSTRSVRMIDTDIVLDRSVQSKPRQINGPGFAEGIN